MSAAGSALAARIRTEMSDLQRVVERVEFLHAKAVERDDSDYYDGVALNLHGFYVGVEHVLQMVARELDGAEPQGPEWRREILSQCAAEIAGVRPAVIATPTREALDEYRAFRHVVRNVYASRLNADRLKSLAASLRPCYELLRADLSAFAAFLEALDDEAEASARHA